MRKLIIISLFLMALSSCSSTNGLKPQSTEKAERPTLIPLSAGVQEISGIVLGGGDQTPEGLFDAPRTYIYQVRLDSGEEINVTYTAYPPSPVSQNQSSPRLTFHAGTINAGDYLTAHGTYDSVSKILTVALETDSIETYPEKP